MRRAVPKSLRRPIARATPRVATRPVDVRSFPGDGTGLLLGASQPKPLRPRPGRVQSSRRVQDETQLAGPRRRLGPPDAAGSVCSPVRPGLDLAVCIPSEPSHRTPFWPLKGSELFESLPCQNAAIIKRGAARSDRVLQDAGFSGLSAANDVDRARSIHHARVDFPFVIPDARGAIWSPGATLVTAASCR
jgi:hypothetical protein